MSTTYFFIPLFCLKVIFLSADINHRQVRGTSSFPLFEQPEVARKVVLRRSASSRLCRLITITLALFLLAPLFICLLNHLQRPIKNYLEKNWGPLPLFLFHSMVMGLMSLYLYFRIDRGLSLYLQPTSSSSSWWWVRKLGAGATTAIFCWLFPLLLSKEHFTLQKEVPPVRSADLKLYALFSAASTLFHFLLGWLIYKCCSKLFYACCYKELKAA